MRATLWKALGEPISCKSLSISTGSPVTLLIHQSVCVCDMHWPFIITAVSLASSVTHLWQSSVYRVDVAIMRQLISTDCNFVLCWKLIFCREVHYLFMHIWAWLDFILYYLCCLSNLTSKLPLYDTYGTVHSIKTLKIKFKKNVLMFRYIWDRRTVLGDHS